MTQTDVLDRPRTATSVPQESPEWQRLSAMVGDLCTSLGLPGTLEVVAELAKATPRDGNVLAFHGQLLAASGRQNEAMAAFAAAIACGTEVEVLSAVANAAFPGPRYQEHLQGLHEWLRPATYLEIGVFDGDALALARPDTRAIGVDPAPRTRADRTYVAPTRIERVTSDAFFASAAADGPDALRLDLAFIDGLHVFEQVLRDFINVERFCHAASVVVLHDTLPVAAAAAARRRRTSYWCGDVWKIIPCLRHYRPDLQLLTIPTHPSGLTLVRGLDPTSRVLAGQFDAAVAGYIDAELPAAIGGDIANDAALIRAWLQQAPTPG